MAGLGWRKFNPGEVLTASNLQGYGIDQSVQVYAGTAARGSAIGTAVSEGMVSYLADIDIIETYDGTKWNRYGNGLVPISPDSVTVAAPGTATSTPVGVTTFSGTTSVSLNGIFSSDFDNYKIIMWQIISTSTDAALTFRYRNGGSDYALNYNWARMGYSGGADSNSATGTTAATLFNINNGATGASLEMTLSNPNTASNIKTTIAVGRGNGGGTGSYVSTSGNSVVSASDGISFLNANNFSGKIQVFGIYN